MSDFDYTASAELYPAKARGFRRQDVSYKRFDSAAEALRFAIEELPPAMLIGAVLEVDEDRYDHLQIRDLYESADYPIARKSAASAAQPAAAPALKARS